MSHSYLVFLIPLWIGYLLDLCLGDPRWLPHPIRLFGNLIYYGEKLLNKDSFQVIKGALLTTTLCVSTFLFFYWVIKFLYYIHPVLYYIFASVFLFYGLANKSLLEEGKEVFDQLNIKGLEAGRKRLSWIVGRDTSQLNANQIRTAVCETLSENLSDGVIAPLFYYALAGVPGMMTYKMINTLDSMIGYKNDKYFYFGKVAARLDDIVNFIPARLTALLMVLVTFNTRGLQFIFQYGHKHASPNSGYPEAALAGILDTRFGGPNVYHGKLVEKPFIGHTVRDITHNEFYRIYYINHATTLLFLLIISLTYYILNRLDIQIHWFL
ncbi:adenosylcobinamide-phosphate synthase CbiB [Xanthocytophaga agilis]|uniref:Cobalamin biosynthesis protein CobD n=1 Tax=Xanthocytophaga agilis TaxID=3048010 RepID=A0AAE3QZP7_9BACT|nr:adenosylcobinamide-phosphate synthase CbiB [Xanthocytophaga agilis]MDJ1499039.1 adenosylcobinamide-phosphate synthase CbiB [Xanthocytophaga agilis]